MGCMTDKQLQELHKDIESGLVMIVETKHYDQLQAEIEAAQKLCEIYFAIAANAIGEDEVRNQRQQALKGGE